MATVASISSLTLGLLFFLGGLATWAKQSKSSREHLASDSLNDGDNVTSIERLLFIIDLFLLYQKQTLTLDFNIIVLLLRGALSQTSTSSNAAFASAWLIVTIRGVVTV